MDTPKTLAARLAEWIVDYSYHPSRPGDTRAIVEAELREDFPEIARLPAPDVGAGLTRLDLAKATATLPFFDWSEDGMTSSKIGVWVRYEDVAPLLAAARAVPGDVELETTAEERRAWSRLEQAIAARCSRDIDTLTAALAASTVREKAKDDVIAGLREALEPFAKAAHRYQNDEASMIVVHTPSVAYPNFYLRAGDFHAAALFGRKPDTKIKQP